MRGVIAVSALATLLAVAGMTGVFDAGRDSDDGKNLSVYVQWNDDQIPNFNSSNVLNASYTYLGVPHDIPHPLVTTEAEQNGTTVRELLFLVTDKYDGASPVKLEVRTLHNHAKFEVAIYIGRTPVALGHGRGGAIAKHNWPES